MKKLYNTPEAELLKICADGDQCELSATGTEGESPGGSGLEGGEAEGDNV